MNATTYTMKYRPVDTFTLPRGIRWAMTERPASGGYERRTDLPMSKHRFGVFATDRPLTADEMDSFEIARVGNADVQF